jgi:hypothetical protein
MTTQGDVIFGGASGLATRLAIGTAGQALCVNGGATAPAWATINPMSAVGDLIKGTTAGAVSRLALGTTLQTLRVNVGATDVEWAAPTPMTTQGDTMFGGASGLNTRLAIGTALQTLRVNAGATAPEWGPPTAMTTQGDTMFGGASGLNTRLAIGTAGQVLRVNAGATAPEWSSSTVSVVTAAIDVHTGAGTSVALPYAASNSFTPTHVVVTCTANMTGDAVIRFGTADDGQEIQADTTMTGLTTAGQRFIVPITAKVVAAIAGNATLWAHVSTIDTTVSGRATVRFIGELV